MKLEFADGTQLNVLTIHGGKQYIRGGQRDVLTIDVSPADATIAELIALFQSGEKTGVLTSIDDSGERHEIGADYVLYLSVSNELREIASEPGVLEPPVYEEVNAVKIAQLTYVEKHTEQLLSRRIWSV